MNKFNYLPISLNRFVYHILFMLIWPHQGRKCNIKIPILEPLISFLFGERVFGENGLECLGLSLGFVYLFVTNFGCQRIKASGGFII